MSSPGTMLSSLSKDIQAIVYRYLYDYRYGEVLRQYYREWISGEENAYIEHTQSFDNKGGGAAANWRYTRTNSTDYSTMKTHVYPFNDSRRLCELPPNYFYSIENLKEYLNL